MAKDYGVWVDIWWLLNWPQSKDSFPPELQAQYEGLTGDALDERIEQSLKGLNETAQRVQNLWLSFLGVSLFFAIATSNTTHEMLFLRKGQALPFFDKITINLDGFAIVGPILYIVLHAYFLTMLIALARTAVPFESAMRDCAFRQRGRSI